VLVLDGDNGLSDRMTVGRRVEEREVEDRSGSSKVGRGVTGADGAKGLPKVS
jgi:hypothetical protein